MTTEDITTELVKEINQIVNTICWPKIEQFNLSNHEVPIAYLKKSNIYQKPQVQYQGPQYEWIEIHQKGQVQALLRIHNGELIIDIYDEYNPYGINTSIETQLKHPLNRKTHLLADPATNLTEIFTKLIREILQCP
jgi:hypothetical protein